MDDVEKEALVDALSSTVQEKQAETLNERLVKVITDALVDALNHTVADEKPDTLSQLWLM